MKIRKQHFGYVLAGLLGVVSLQAGEPVSPQSIGLFGPVPVQKPVLLDSTNLNNTAYSDEMLLSSPISFPAQERFAKEVTPDTAGFFFLEKPATSKAFQLLSFYVAGDRYGKGKLTVTSPNPLELWVNGVKRATKTRSTTACTSPVR